MSASALAIAAGVIASSKGRSGFGYFILGALFPLIGVLKLVGEEYGFSA